MIDAYFYLDEKYNFSEEQISQKQILDVLENITPRYIEDFVRVFLAKQWSLSPKKIVSPNLEVDIALTRFKKLEIVGEVKWKKKISRKEVMHIEEKLTEFSCRKILVVPNKKSLEFTPNNIEVLTAKDLVRLAHEQ